MLDLVVIAEKEENQLGRRGDEDKSQPVVKTYAALEDCLCQPADANAGVQMRPAP